MPNFPPSALPFPSAPAGGFPEYRAAVINSIKSQVDHGNALLASNFSGACSNWTLANSRNRDMGLKLTPKPEPPTSQVVNTFEDTDSDIIWVWQEDGLPVSAPCPDLPALPVAPPPNNANIGLHIYGAFWQCLPDDTTVSGSVLTLPSGMPVPAGKYRKNCSPFGCTYEKVA